MAETSFEPRHNEMGRHMISGIFNSGLLQVVKVLCQFVSVIVLSRLLPPSDFGILAMVSPVYGFITMFQDLGLSQATVQKPGLNHGEVNAFFWINVAVGLLLTIFIIAISPVVGWYYGEPRTVPLTMAMGLLILVGAAGNQPGAILTRRMEFGVAAVLGALGAIAGLAVSIAGALILKNYWALYWGTAAGIILPVIGVWIATGWKPSLPRRVPGLRAMLQFGGHLTGANVATYFAGNMDNVLIGHRWGDHDLGLYDRAYKLLLFPLQRIAGPITSILIPVLSRLTSEPEQYRSIFFKTVRQLTLAIWPGIIWAIVLADILVPMLLGKQWVNTVPIFQPLAISGLVQIVNYPLGPLLISQGRAVEFARWSIVSTIICIISFLIGLPYGPVGVATAFAICVYMLTPFFWWYATRSGPIGRWDIPRAILPQSAGALASGLALLGYRTLVHAPPLFLLSGGLILSYAVTVLTMCLSPAGRETLKQTMEAGRRILGHMRLKSEN